MKAQSLFTTNVQGDFFVPKSVLAGGGNCSAPVDTYQQVHNYVNKPSLRRLVSLCGLPAA